MKPGKTGIRRIIDASQYSLAGLKFAWTNEAAFRQETLLACIMIPSAFWLGTTAAQQALLIGSCMIVIIAELFNTSIEAVVDRIGHEHHDLAGSAKDLGSAAVLISLMLTAVIWLLIIAERFLQ